MERNPFDDGIASGSELSRLVVHASDLMWDHINVKKGREYLEKEQNRSVLQLQVMAEAT